ncbi:MAG: transporter substrate-binding domain-containing protein [Gammaproteobacteria bacterium]|nr:transporter substrate-binding domain-containing protein [Gammaproteobacteria bacterium]
MHHNSAVSTSIWDNTDLLWLTILLILAIACGRSGTLMAAESEKNIKVIFSGSTPPYVFRDGSGIVVDLVREALIPHGITITPVYLPIGRGSDLFARGKVDATSIIKKSSGLQGHYSDYFMQYHNFAITLKGKAPIDSVTALQQGDVVGFQNAHIYLGEAFGKAVSGNPNYREMADQERQVLMLLRGRIHVAVMDEAIFKYYRLKLIDEGEVSRKVEATFNNLFTPSQYRTAFIDAAIRDKFDLGMQQLRDSGRYETIYDRYTTKYFAIRH